ncbi:MAG: MATE family efflux transporter [Candidatus Bathyarchaeota archaeon]|nr:MATE family efflux transporter [Candidatus Bathyarchaeota archaeon]
MTIERAAEYRSLTADLERGRATRAVLRLAAPVVVERVSISVLYAIDALLVGRFVGSDGVAAVGMGALLIWIVLSGAWGFDVAATAVVARDAGAGEVSQVERSMRASLLLALVWGCLATVVLWPLAGPLLELMALEPEAKSFGVDYIRAASLGFPLLMVLYAANGCLRGLGNTVLPMLILIAAQVANALVAFFLISGVFGLPQLEVLASGIGFGSAGAIGGVLGLGVLASRLSPVPFRVDRALATGRRDFQRVLNVGLPVTGEEFQFSVAFIAYSRVISGLGTTALAAHTLALRALELAIVPGFALATAATAIVGQCLGAGRPDLAERAGLEARKWALLSMITLGLLMAILAPQLVSVFVDDDEVVNVGGRLLRIFALALPMMGIGSSLSGALRGAGDVRYVLAVLTLTAWLVRIPTAWILAGAFGLGAPGAWVGAVVENNVRGALVWLRFRGGRWKTMRV